MKIVVERRKYAALAVIIQDAIDDNDKSSLCEDILGCFTDEQSEETEDLLGEEFSDFIEEIVEDWDSDDGETLWEMIVQKLEDEDITIVIGDSSDSEDGAEDEDEDEEEDDEDKEEDEDDDEDDEDD